MLLQNTKLIIILLVVVITWCSEAVANPTFDGYRYEKPSIAFDYPTAIRMMPKTVATKPTPTKAVSVKVETKPKQTLALKENKEIEKTTKTTSHKIEIQNSNFYRKPTTLIKPHNLSNNKITSNNHNIQHNHNHLKPGHSLKEIIKTSSIQGQQYIYEKPLQTDDLEKFLNRDNEFIYRLSTNVGKHPSKTHNNAVKRLKLKQDFTHPIVQCGDQNIETLKVKFSERSHHRPLERRLTPYTETVIDKEYFE